MQNIITVGKRLILVEQIALVEAFDPARNPEFKPEKAFKGRVVLLNRDTVLTEMNPREFAEANGLRFLEEDGVAINPAVLFSVEAFEATETFRPEKPYATRLKWRDQSGNEQSKLLLAKPEAVLAATRGADAQARKDVRPRAGRRSSRNNGRKLEASPF